MCAVLICFGAGVFSKDAVCYYWSSLHLSIWANSSLEKGSTIFRKIYFARFCQALNISTQHAVCLADVERKIDRAECYFKSGQENISIYEVMELVNICCLTQMPYGPRKECLT